MRCLILDYAFMSKSLFFWALGVRAAIFLGPGTKLLSSATYIGVCLGGHSPMNKCRTQRKGEKYLKKSDEWGKDKQIKVGTRTRLTWITSKYRYQQAHKQCHYQHHM